RPQLSDTEGFEPVLLIVSISQRVSPRLSPRRGTPSLPRRHCLRPRTFACASLRIADTGRVRLVAAHACRPRLTLPVPVAHATEGAPSRATGWADGWLTQHADGGATDKGHSY